MSRKLLACLIVFISMISQNLHALDFNSGGLSYTTNGNTGEVIITGVTNTSVSSVTIPPTVTNKGTAYPVKWINMDAFNKCKALKTVTVEDSEDPLIAISRTKSNASIEEVYMGRPVVDFFSNIKSIKKVTFSDNLTWIANESLWGCTGLTEITIPGSVSSISKNAFTLCENLSSVTFLPGDGELAISSDAFSSCPIYNINLGRNVEAHYKFMDVSLDKLVVTKDVDEVSGVLFLYSKHIKELIIEDSEIPLEMDYNSFGKNIGELYLGRNIPSYGNFVDMPTLKEVTVGGLVTELTSGIFTGDIGLEKVTFGESLQKIPGNSFCGCKSLANVLLPESIQEIGSMAFYGCEALSSVHLSTSLKKIESSAFNGCVSLSEISLPGSLESIYDRVFENCPMLKKIVIEDGNSVLGVSNNSFGSAVEELYLGRNINSVGVFADFVTLKEVVIGNEVTEIGETCFYGDKNLKKVVLGNGVLDIKSWAFRNCASLTDIVLPASLRKVMSQAFYGCDALTSVKSLATIPPAAGSQMFSDVVYEKVPLEVPSGTKAAYAAADEWKNFANIVSGSYKISVTYDASMGGVRINGQDGTEFAVQENDDVAIEIIPAEGYKIESVKIDGVESIDKFVDGSYTADGIQGNMTVEVLFSRITFMCYVHYDTAECNVTLSVDGESSTSAIVPYGANWRIDISASSPYRVVSVTVDNHIESQTIPLESNYFEIEKVTEDFDVTVNCELVTYKASVFYDSVGGTVTLNGEQAKSIDVVQYSPLVIEAFPETGYHVGWLSINGVECTSGMVDNTYIINNVSSDTEIRIRFDIDMFSFTTEYDASHGSVSVNGNTANELNFAYGEKVVVELYPAEGWELGKALLNGDDVTSRFSDSGIMTIDAVKESGHLEIYWKEKLVKLSLVGFDGGRVANLVPYNSILTYEIIPDEGWSIHSLTFNGELVDTDEENRFTTPQLTDDATLSVVFSHDVTVGVSGALMSAVNVVTRNGSIFINGALDSSVVEIYGVDGKCIYRGTDREIAVTRGNVYIVLIEGREFKVIP